jgi:hypothetical protein
MCPDAEAIGWHLIMPSAPEATHEGFWSSPQEPEGDLASIQSLIF